MRRLALLVLLSATSVLSANILYVSTIPAPSHHIWNRVLAFGLANRGHNVTMLGPDKDETHPDNYSHIYLEGVYEAFHDDLYMLELAEYTPTQTILESVNFCDNVCKVATKAQGLQQLLNYPSNYKFDLIIFDITPGSCFYPLIHRFDYPPSAAVTAFLLPAYKAYNFGNHLYPGYVPWYGVPYTNNMTFVERIWNTIFSYGDTLIKNFYQVKLEHEEAKKVFGQDIPSMQTLERHLSLLLANYDPVLSYPQPLAPNIIPVGGLHTRKSNNIPQDLLKVLDGAENGAIVFSLGTTIRSDYLDNKTQRALLDAFSKLKQTVIWKFESNIGNLPKNVIVRKWLPQNDLLGHPNVKLFIGHGGALSTHEAIFHGIPLVAVPFSFDQHVTTKFIVDKKLGVSLDYKLITSAYVLQKIIEVLDNPIYLSNMQRVSNIFKDRLETPLDRAIFWLEYVIRHGGAHFLNNPARDMPFYKSSGLDIYAFLILVTSTIVLLLYTIFRLVLPSHELSKKLKEQ